MIRQFEQLAIEALTDGQDRKDLTWAFEVSREPLSDALPTIYQAKDVAAYWYSVAKDCKRRSKAAKADDTLDWQRHEDILEGLVTSLNLAIDLYKHLDKKERYL